MTFSPPTTSIEIISRAATLLGKQSFNSLDAGGPLARDGDALLDSLVSAELASNRWKFALEFKQMSTLTTLTPSFDGWLYYWQVPSDLMMLLYIDPFIDYTVFGNKVLTKSNGQSLTAVYSKNVPVSEWPATFSMYIICKLSVLPTQIEWLHASQQTRSFGIQEPCLQTARTVLAWRLGPTLTLTLDTSIKPGGVKLCPCVQSIIHLTEVSLTRHCLPELISIYIQKGQLSFVT